MSEGYDEQTRKMTQGAKSTHKGSASDRNLLFGILALQMDFVDREQLIAAMNQWVLEKGTPLGAILCRTNAMTQDELDLLTALVDKHLEKHHRNPHQSLAALSSIGTLRTELSALKDDDLNASLVRVTEYRPTSVGPLPEDLGNVSVLTSEEVRFRILRFHDKGGLGRIYVARDEELGRDVALKEIRPEWADDDNCRARFVLEAEVTGGLEHPGIVPVYGLGQYRDGRPFYAMRFIRGDSLRSAIQRYHDANWTAGRTSGEKHLELRKLLGRFNDVCQAIEYAHSRGVLHRDLKPGNVMLGKYGETLVVDWGLAKTAEEETPWSATADSMLQPRSSSGSAPTEMGLAIGTPAYMSPEQAAGRWDMLGRSSDIYSLGATLYHLLTGRAPIEAGDAEAARRQAEAGDVRPPRDIESGIPRPLAAICQKAMAAEQSDRYESAAALAEDVEHWMADEPVSAYSEPWTTRFARWERRHKPLVAGLVVLLLTTLVGLAIGNILLRQANQLTLQQRQRAQAMVDDYFTLVSEEQLLDEPGMQPLRQKLLERAREYYQQFVDERSSDSAARFELAKAYIRLGVINNSIGTPEQSTANYRIAQQMLQELAQNNPDSDEYRTQLARASCNYASMIWHEGKFDQAMALYVKARDLTEELSRTPTEHARATRWHVASLTGIGSLKSWRGRHKEALAEYSSAIDLVRRLAEADPDDPKPASDLATLYINTGLSNVSLNRRQEAIPALKKAREVLEGIVEERPQSVRFREELTVACLKLGMEQSFFGQSEAAMEALQKAQELAETLHREHPKDKDIRANLAEANLEHGVLLWRSSALAEARPLFVKAASLYRDLATENQGIPEYPFGEAKSLNGLAFSQNVAGEVDEAIKTNERAIAVFTELTEQYPLRPDYQNQLGGNLHNYAMILLEMEKCEEALEAFERAIVHQKKALDIMPKAPQYRLFLSNHYSGRSAAQRGLGMLAEAVATTLLKKAMWPGNPIQLYKTGRDLALSADLVGNGKEDLNAGDRAERSRLAEMAVTCLNEAVDAGFDDSDAFEHDPSLESIRSLESFKAVLKRLSAESAAGRAKTDGKSSKPVDAKDDS